jgi:hypothetical protein
MAQYFILSARSRHHFLCEKCTEKVTSPPSTPPNHWEFDPTSQQEVAMAAHLQETARNALVSTERCLVQY